MALVHKCLLEIIGIKIQIVDHNLSIRVEEEEEITVSYVTYILSISMRFCHLA